MQKNELNTYYATYTEINRTHIIDLDVKPKTILFWKKFLRKSFFDIRCLYFLNNVKFFTSLVTSFYIFG